MVIYYLMSIRLLKTRRTRKMIKKILAVSVSAVMMLAMSVSAFAAGTISASEQAIIDELQAKKVPAEYVSQARNYMEQDGVDFTDAQKTTVIANIDDAATIAKSANIKSADDLKKASSTVIDSLMAKVSAAATAVDLKVSLDAKTGVAKVTDKAGKVVATTNTGIKTTGADSMETVAVVSLLGLAVVALTVVTKKHEQA